MHLQNFSGSLNKGRIWWYNILGDNEGSISHLLRLDPISACSVSLTSKIVALKRKNTDLILIVKRTERKKFIDYFGLSIESDPSRVGKKNVCFFCIGSIPIPLSMHPHISRQQPDKELNL